MDRKLLLSLGLAVILGVTTRAFADPEVSGADLCRKNFDSYKDRLAKNPDDGQGWAEFRACVSELKRWNEGQEVASIGIQQRPQRFEPHLILGIALLHGKEYQKACDEFQTATELKPDQAQPFYYLGMAKLFLNHPAEAAESAEKATQLEPKNATYESQLAYADFLLEDNAKSEEAAKRAIALDPNNIAAYKVLGNLYEREGRQAESDQAFENAMHANGRTATTPMVPRPISSLPGMAPAPVGSQPPVPIPRSGGGAPPPVMAESPIPETSDAADTIKSQWAAMREAVAQSHMEKALSYFSDYADTRTLYRQSFEKLGVTRVQGMMAALGDIEDCDVVIAVANCKAPISIRPGEMADATIRFERNTDNVWRIRSF